MRLKTEWYSHLHSVRQREIDLIFARCPAQAFEHGLELGAGDGFQSTLLTKYVARLVSTDLNPNRLRRTDTETVAYMTCDAENVNAFFDRGQFDLVFSSSLLEHLPRLDQALHGIHTVLKDGGITIHVIPNQFWKLGHVALYHPNRLITKLERIIQPRPTDNQRDRDMDNNLKTPRRERRSRLWPAPHGAYNSNLEEFRAFGKTRWLSAFEQAGFTVSRVMRGPVVSGYGLGLDRLRRLLEQVGISSFYIFVAIKDGQSSPHAVYFT